MSTNINQYTIEGYKLNYRACIPLYVLLDKNLSGNEVKLYGLIEQMESSCKDVFISDRKFAEILGISFESGKIQTMKRKLIKKNYIKRELRLVKIGKRTAEMHCWSTVKGTVAEYNTAPVPEGLGEYKINTAPVPEGLTPPVPQGLTCNTHNVNAHNSITTTTGEPFTESQKSISEPVVVVLNSQKITNQLLNAFRANPVETKNIKTEEDFLCACEYSIIHRNDGNNGNPLDENERVRGIIKLVKQGAFEDPKGWSKQKPVNKKEIEDRLKKQEEASLRKWQEEEKSREVDRQKKLQTPITIDLAEQPLTKLLGGVLKRLPSAL